MNTILWSPQKGRPDQSNLKEPFGASLNKQLGLLMVLRVITISILLGVTIYLQLRQQNSLLNTPLVALYCLCAAVYFLTLIYALALKKNLFPHLHAYFQLTLDVIFIGAFIYVTDGFNYFSFLFFITILNSSIILRKKGALFIAVFSGFLFGLLFNLYFFKIIPPMGDSLLFLTIEQMIERISYNSLAFLMMALLSGNLAEKISVMGQKLKEKQSDLNDLENLHLNIIKSLSSGLITISTELRITSFNHAAEDITGLVFADVFNQPLSEVFTSMQNRIFEGNNRWEEIFYRKADQKKLILGFSKTILKHHDGRRLGTILNFQDVTYQKAMEDRMIEEEKMAAIGRLAAGIAHEIRNPLASVSGSVQMLRDDLNLKGQHRKLMNIVTRETQRLNVLIEGFLDFAKPKQNSISIVSLNEMISEMIEVGLQHFKSFNGNSTQLEFYGETTPVYIKADSSKLRQVFWNLLLNSFQAIKGADGKIILRMKCSEENPEKVMIEIEDNGEGISKKDMSFIFEPFFTTKPKGTGLGLATVKRIIEENSWDIEVESDEGKGSLFRIILNQEKMA